jgi:hypothetical protein
MRNLKAYFIDPFDSVKNSDAELFSFATDHLDRLTAANTNGALSGMLTATRTALEAFTGATQREDTASNQRTGITGTMTEAKKAFADFASRKEGVIRDALGGSKTAPGYLEFYPQGVSEYRNASLETIEALMERFCLTAERRARLVGTAFGPEARTLKAAFVAARTAQLSKKGTVSAEKSAARAARQALTLQLTRNLLEIAGQNIGHPERLTIYFDPARLG